jgi:hypothetical protein
MKQETQTTAMPKRLANYTMRDLIQCSYGLPPPRNPNLYLKYLFYIKGIVTERRRERQEHAVMNNVYNIYIEEKAILIKTI